jgi:hypothetical protein
MVEASRPIGHSSLLHTLDLPAIAPTFAPNEEWFLAAGRDRERDWRRLPPRDPQNKACASDHFFLSGPKHE